MYTVSAVLFSLISSLHNTSKALVYWSAKPVTHAVIASFATGFGAFKNESTKSSLRSAIPIERGLTAKTSGTRSSLPKQKRMFCASIISDEISLLSKYEVCS